MKLFFLRLLSKLGLYKEIQTTDHLNNLIRKAIEEAGKTRPLSKYMIAGGLVVDITDIGIYIYEKERLLLFINRNDIFEVSKRIINFYGVKCS